MPTSYRHEEKIRLTEVERRVLVALLQSCLHAYEVGRVMDQDSEEDTPYSSGTIYPALRRLCAMHMVEKLPPNGIKRSTSDLYCITSTGRTILQYDMGALKRFLKVAQDRLDDPRLS